MSTGDLTREIKLSTLEEIEARIADLERLIAEQKRRLEAIEDALTRPEEASHAN